MATPYTTLQFVESDSLGRPMRQVAAMLAPERLRDLHVEIGDAIADLPDRTSIEGFARAVVTTKTEHATMKAFPDARPFPADTRHLGISLWHDADCITFGANPDRLVMFVNEEQAQRMMEMLTDFLKGTDNPAAKVRQKGMEVTFLERGYLPGSR